MAPLVVPLGALDAGDRARVGGKAAHLGAMTQRGWPVPPGFALTCDAYHAHVDGLDTAGLDAAALSGRPLPAAVADALRAALAALPCGAVAVRSSAVDEDAAGASFAGQHDTFLDVQGAGAVEDAVRSCWASLWSPRAVRYRLDHGLTTTAAMGCVVQCMVPAEAAGVVFTADPLSGERDRLVVNVVRGLGEALVSGLASASQVTLRKSDGAVLEGALPEGLVPLDELRRLALEVERHFGMPQDVEWAVAGGRVLLLQARPITNLPPEPVALADAQRPILYYPERVREMMPGPLSPLTADFVMEAVIPLVHQNLLRHHLLPAPVARATAQANAVVDGRIYIDLSGLRQGMLPALDELALVEMLENGRRPPLRALRPRALLGSGLGAPRAAWTLLRMLPRLREQAGLVCRTFDTWMSPLEHADLGAWSDEQLLGLLHLRHPPGLMEAAVAAPPANPVARMMGTVFFTAVDRLAVRWAGEEPGVASVLVAGEPGLPEVECAAALWDLAEQARALPVVRAALESAPARALEATASAPEALAWRDAFQAFLDRFGHRAIEEVELARPRWRDEPAYPLGVIASYLRLPPESGPRAVEARRCAERAEAEARITARLRRPWRRRLFLFVLDVARQASLAGQTTKFEVVRLLALVRAAVLELGRRRVEQGRLQAAEDAFFLGYADLAPGTADLRPLADARRREHQRRTAQDPAPLIDGRHRPIREGRRPRPPVAEDGALTGIGSSPGLARGRVRVILDPSLGFELRPGEVLVAPFTDPGWTPLFVTAGALVVETGSLLSHASIVAREMGLPAVVAIPGATRLLCDGQEVEVDGTRGRVRVLS